MHLKIREVANLLCVSNNTVHRWIKEGSLSANRVHDQYYVDRTELLAWITVNNMPVPEQFFDEVKQSESEPSLLHAIEDGGCLYRVEGKDKVTVLHNVVSGMCLPAGLDKEFLFRALLVRESVCPTAIGDGIAIPHPHSPIVFNITRPLINVSFLEEPMEFGAMDGKPVRVLFTLITPTIHTHLQILSRLGFALHDSGFKKIIHKSGSQEAILKEAGRLDALLGSRGQSASA